MSVLMKGRKQHRSIRLIKDARRPGFNTSPEPSSTTFLKIKQPDNMINASFYILRKEFMPHHVFFILSSISDIKSCPRLLFRCLKVNSLVIYSPQGRVGTPLGNIYYFKGGSSSLVVRLMKISPTINKNK